MSLLYDFYETTLGYDWDMIPVDRSLDENKVSQYLNLLPNDNDKNFMREFLSTTTYINFDLFKNALYASFIKFQKNIKNEEFYILTSSDDKIGSEDWIIAILWPYIRQMNIKNFININTILQPGIINIAIFDDAIYSGINIESKIDELIENIANHLHISFELLKSKGYLFTFI